MAAKDLNVFHLGGEVWRGPAPKNYAQMQQLIDLGIGYWLHLENGYQRLLPSGWRHQARDWQVRACRRYIYMPFSNLEFPDERVLQWCGLQIQASATLGGGVYVSCKHGKDRTGITIAYWRVKHCGWTPQAAWDESQMLGMHSFYLWLGWEKKFFNLFRKE